MSLSQDNVPLEIDCRTLKDRLDRGESLLLIDCREPDEHQKVRIEAAKLIPMGQITQRVDELLPFKDQPIVVHCHHGGRSLRVTNWLRQQGFSQVQNLAGGIDRWAVEIDPKLPRY